MPEPTAPVPRSWGPDLPVPHGKARRYALLVVLLTLVVLAGVTVGLLYWLSPPRTPNALPVWVTAEAGVEIPVPWAVQDRAAILDGRLLGHPLDDTANPNRDQLRYRFRALERLPRRQPLVVYLAAPASVDATGGVYLLPADPLGDHPRNRLPLVELLAHVRDCPARNKLVILHLTPLSDDPLFAPPAGALSTAIAKALDDTPDAARLCLVACGPGQTPHASPDLGHSAFGHYVEIGLRGAADGWGPNGDRDGRVSVTELAAFVRTRVGRWAAENLRSPQTPVLVGSAADFTIRSYPLPESAALPESSPSGNPAPSIAYPDWLRAGWDRHDRWLADGQAAGAPRVLARLRATLLAAERDLLAGRPAGDVQQALDRQLGQLDQLVAAFASVPAPSPLPTLAAAFPGYAPTDPAVLRELADATRTDPGPPVAAPLKPGEKPPAAPPLPAVFEPLVKKPHPDLALAAFRVLADDSAPSAGRVRRMAQLLAIQSPAPKFAETVLVQRLAELADPAVSGAPWSAERAALALQTMRMLEEAASRPEVVAWAQPALDQANRLRVDAEAMLFAPGYANPAEAERRLQAAADAARQLKASSDQLRGAIAAQDEGLFWLTGLTAAVDPGLVAFADVLRLTDATRQLGDSLARPDQPVDAAGFAELARSWRDREAAVRAALGTVSTRFRPAALARLRGRADAADADQAVLGELNAVLATPLVPAADRVTLWNVRASLDRRLNDATVRKDSLDDDAIRRRLASPEPIDPRDPTPAVTVDGERIARRANWTTALLRVGGVREGVVNATASKLSNLAGNLPAFGARLRRVWLEELPDWLDHATSVGSAARLARIAPVVRATSVLDQADRNPGSVIRRDQARRLWAWHASEFEYWAREASAIRPESADAQFAHSAARACALVAAPPATPFIDIGSVQPIALTPEKQTANMNVAVRLLGSAASQSVLVRVLSPAEQWVRATDERRTELNPVRAQPVPFEIAAGSQPSAYPDLKGVLIEGEVGGRSYHRRVPVSLDAITNRLDLYFRASPTDPPRPANAIALRPLAVPQSYQLLLSNPTPKARVVVARLRGFDRVTAPVTVDPGKVAPLKFPAPAPVAPPAPPPMGQPAPAEPTFDLLQGPLVVELFDPSDLEKVVQHFTVPVTVLDPADYLKADEAVFRPAAGARPNRLSVQVVPESLPPGPPCQIVVSLPPTRNPDLLQVRDANLSGPMPKDNRPLTLYAENIAFTGPAGGKLTVTVAADGVERAFTFAGEVIPNTGTIRLGRLTQPMVRVTREKGQWYALPAVPLPVPLEVDNAPAGATVELRLGTETINPATRIATFATDVAMTVEPAKERAAGIRFDPKGESIFLRGTLKDPSPSMPVGLLVGERTLEARLLDATGAVLDVDRTTVIFDGTPPTDVHFIDLPPQTGKGQQLTVRATCEPTVSGIKEVKFFIGQPAKNAPPSNPPPVPGQLIDPKGNIWQGTLSLGKDDRVTVGVQFTTKAGLSKIETAEVELVDPAELTKPKPGKITGKLTESNIAQGDHPVYLYDDKRKPIAQTKTRRDGTYEFANVPPGKYYVYSIHVETNRDAMAEVTVNAGATTTKDLEMYLRSTPP